MSRKKNLSRVLNECINKNAAVKMTIGRFITGLLEKREKKVRL